MTDLPIDKKVPDAGLRSFLEHEAGERRSILVELNLATPKAALEVSKGRLRPVTIVPTNPSDDSEARDGTELVRRAGSRIAAITGAVPTWLRTAGCFLVEVTAGELKQILTSSDVRSVRPNRSWQA